MNSEAVVLTLYHRYGCHLCEEMLERLQELATVLDFRVDIVDVDADLDLKTEYNERVPVLALGDRQIAQYFLDEDVLKNHLA